MCSEESGRSASCGGRSNVLCIRHPRDQCSTGYARLEKQIIHHTIRSAVHTARSLHESHRNNPRISPQSECFRRAHRSRLGFLRYRMAGWLILVIDPHLPRLIWRHRIQKPGSVAQRNEQFHSCERRQRTTKCLTTTLFGTCNI